MPSTPTYIYNFTIHCEAHFAPDVLFYLQKVMLPTWQEYPYWHQARLLKLHQASTPLPEEVHTYALQCASYHPEELRTFRPEADPCVQKIEHVYGAQVQFTATILEVL